VPIASTGDLYASVERITRRLEELGDRAAAERLRVAMAGATSGEIFGALSAELAKLLETPLRHDAQVGVLLREAKDAVDEALRPGTGRLRRLRGRLGLG
jgi:hypothetical protein